MDTASYWKVYLFGFIFFSLITYTAFILSNNQLNIIHKKSFNDIVIKVSIGFGLFFSGFICLMTKMARDSKKFWETAKALELKIDEANTKEELDRIWANEFKSLRDLCGGEFQLGASIRLHTIFVTKYKYVP